MTSIVNNACRTFCELTHQGNLGDIAEFAGLQSELVTKVRDTYSKAPSPLASTWQSMKVERIVREADDVRSFYLAPTNNRPLPSFSPGQHIAVRIPKPVGVTNAVKFPPSRCYTLSGVADPRFFRITVKRNAAAAEHVTDEPLHQRSMSHFLHGQIQVGSTLEVRGPNGRFTSKSAANNQPLLLFSAGIGVTPSVAIAVQELLVNPERDIWMFYQSQLPAQTPLASELLALAREYPRFKLVIAFSRITEIDNDDTVLPNIRFVPGRLAPREYRLIAPISANSYAFICGPTVWMQETISALQNAGLPESQIHFESFGGEAIVTPSESESPESENVPSIAVALENSKTALKYRAASGSLLDQLQRAGIDVTGGCRAGSCGSCMTRMLCGKVEYANPPEAKVEKDWILPCVAKPCSDLTLDL